MHDIVSEHLCFGGRQGFYKHASAETGLPMRFSVFTPPQAVAGKPLPALFFLAGLTCTEETFMIKAGAQRLAAELGLILVAPDTSPRNTGIAQPRSEWDFGHGAGFYLDATQEPWSKHFRMESWIVRELAPLVVSDFGADPERIGIFGHSMGGHGALTLAMRHPRLFRSVSAFAPIAAPSRCPWGEKAFTGYLGADRAAWLDHDASELMMLQFNPPFPKGILVDQGMADPYLQEQLYPDIFEQACAEVGQPLTLRRHAAYDHGYYFIASFIEDHLRLHAQQLGD